MLKLALAAGLGALVLAAPGLPAQEAAKLNDANVVAIFVKANQKDVDTGNLAAEKASNKEVKEMGKMFADAHKGLKKQAEDLAKKIGVNPVLPADNQGRPGARQGGEAPSGAKSGADFDKDWLAHEIAYHQAVIDVRDQDPVCRPPRIRSLRPSLKKQHRRSRVTWLAAQNLQKKLGYTT